MFMYGASFKLHIENNYNCEYRLDELRFDEATIDAVQTEFDEHFNNTLPKVLNDNSPLKDYVACMRICFKHDTKFAVITCDAKRELTDHELNMLLDEVFIKYSKKWHKTIEFVKGLKFCIWRSWVKYNSVTSFKPMPLSE
eukprot:gene19615-26299_t